MIAAMTRAKPTEILFYHLERLPLERVLPGLLERTLERGWKAVVQGSSQERIEALDKLLWSYREDTFLPHGREGDGAAERQPVYLTSTDDNPNAAEVRFLVDGAEGNGLEAYTRAVYIFDGQDDEAVARARDQWRSAQEAGHDVTYWQQDERGKWQKKA